MNKILLKAIETGKKRAFWKTPEGRTAIILGIIALALTIWLLPKLIKLVLVIAGNLLLLGIVGGVIALIALTLIYGKTRKGLFTGFKKALKTIASVFAELNPFVKLKKNISLMVKNSREIGHLYKELAEMKSELNAKKLKSEKLLTESEQLMQIAKAQGNENMLSAQIKNIDREKASYERLLQLNEKMDSFNTVLAQVRYEMQEDMVDIMEEMRQKQRMRKEANSKLTLWKRVKNIFDDDDDETVPIDRSIDHIADAIRDNVKKLNPLVDSLRNFVDSVNLSTIDFDKAQAELVQKAVEKLKEEPIAEVK